MRNPRRYFIIKVSAKRWQAALSWMSSGVGDVMLPDCECFGPKFPTWRQAFDYAVQEMTPEQRAAQRRTDGDS